MTNKEVYDWWNSLSLKEVLKMESFYLFEGDFEKYPEKYDFFSVGVARKIRERWEATKDMT